MKTRFSPSPTGQMHLGNVRTALFSFLLARHEKGKFLLRIEDTDKTRSSHAFTALLQENLKWLGVQWDEGPFFQSERQAVYNQYYARLEAHQQAYPCFCSDAQLALSRKIQMAAGQPPRYSGTCRHLSADEIAVKKAQGFKPALRFKVPADDQEISFHDLIKGEQRFRTGDIGDFIIRRADGSASFFFCNAIDDSLMGITHAIRGEDHLTNTPRQILILNALGLAVPQYGHLSLILAENDSPLSKREGSLSLETLRKADYLPLALLNYLCRLGHYYETHHLMSLSDMAEHFSTTRLGKAPAHFDPDQLLHWQKLAVNHLSDELFWEWLTPDTKALIPGQTKSKFIALLKPYILFPSEAEKWAAIFYKSFQLDTAAQNMLNNAGEKFLTQFAEAVEQVDADYDKVITLLAQSSGLKGKALFQPLRIILTGQTAGPELRGIFDLLGKERLLNKKEDRLL